MLDPNFTRNTDHRAERRPSRRPSALLMHTCHPSPSRFRPVKAPQNFSKRFLVTSLDTRIEPVQIFQALKQKQEVLISDDVYKTEIERTTIENSHTKTGIVSGYTAMEALADRVSLVSSTLKMHLDDVDESRKANDILASAESSIVAGMVGPLIPIPLTDNEQKIAKAEDLKLQKRKFLQSLLTESQYLTTPIVLQAKTEDPGVRKESVQQSALIDSYLEASVQASRQRSAQFRKTQEALERDRARIARSTVRTIRKESAVNAIVMKSAHSIKLTADLIIEAHCNQEKFFHRSKK